MIRKESPFLQLPTNLNPKQALFLDGIRFATEMADVAYNRLVATLLTMSEERSDGSSVEIEAAAAFLDAWSIVDAINRLRDLQNQMPGLKKSAGFKLFMKKTQPFADLRDIVQHLNTEIPKMATKGVPVWGTLKWFTLMDAEARTGRSCVLVAGRITQGTFPIVNPAGRALRARVDHVALTCSGVEASLSDGLATVEQMVQALEPSLEKSFAGLPRAGADILFMADMQFFDPEPPAPDQGAA